MYDPSITRPRRRGDSIRPDSFPRATKNHLRTVRASSCPQLGGMMNSAELQHAGLLTPSPQARLLQFTYVDTVHTCARVQVLVGPSFPHGPCGEYLMLARVSRRDLGENVAHTRISPPAHVHA